MTTRRDFEFSVDLSIAALIAEVNRGEKFIEDLGRRAKVAFDGMEKSARAAGGGVDSQLNASLRRSRAEFERLGNRAERSFNQIRVNARSVGRIIEIAIGNVIANIINGVARFAENAARAFGNLILESAKLSNDLELLRRRFTAVFSGQEEIADAVMDRISDRAAELGVELEEALSLGATFLPLLGAVEDPIAAVEELLFLQQGLFIISPEQRGRKGGLIALTEALSGNLESLQRRFEFTAEEINRLEELQKELGTTAGLVQGVREALAGRGITEETIAGTLIQATGRVQIILQQLRDALGTPIAEEFTEALNNIAKFFNDNAADISELATIMGEAISLIIEASSNLTLDTLEDIDLRQLREAALDIGGVAARISELIENLDRPETGGFLTTISNLADDMDRVAVNIARVLDALDRLEQQSGPAGQLQERLTFVRDLLIDLLAIVNPAFAGLQAGFQSVEDVLDAISASTEEVARGLIGLGNLAITIAEISPGTAFFRSLTPGVFDQLRAKLAELTAEFVKGDEAVRDVTAAENVMRQGFTRTNEELDRRTELFELGNKLIRAGASATEEEIIQLEKEAEAARASAEAIKERFQALLLEQGLTVEAERLQDQLSAAEELADFLTDASEAARKAFQEQVDAAEDAKQKIIDEVLEDLIKAEEQMTARIQEILIKGFEKRADLETKLSRDRVDAERERLQEIEDITRKFNDRLSDEALKLTQKEQEILRKSNDDRLEIERDRHKKRIDAERDFRRELEKIQREFLRDAREAEIRNDALAFVQAIRRRNDRIEDARARRDDQQQDADQDAQERAEQLKRSQEIELREARIRARIRAEELERQREREFRDLEIDFARDREARNIKFQRDLEDLELSLQRQIEAQERGMARKLESLLKGLDAEVAAVVEAEARKIDALRRSQAIINDIIDNETRKLEALKSGIVGLTNRTAPDPTPRGGGGQGGIGIRQRGGPVERNRPYVVGEDGPELFVPASSGRVLPNRDLIPALFGQRLPSLAPGNVTTNNNSPTFNLAENMFDDPVARMRLENFVLGVMTA